MIKKVKKKQNNTLNKPLLLISIILLLTAISIKESNAIRPIFWILSIIILAINIKKTLKYSNSKVIIISLILLFTSIILDGIIVCTFKRIPVFTYSIIKKEKTIVYNSLGMRVWQCNEENVNNIIVDPFYKKGYMCDANDIETIDINSFLNSVVQNHSEYKNNYVKIKGKISKKSGINSIEMRPYTETENKVNGYVEFANNITLKVLFRDDINLDSYDVYDEITIIGIVKNMESSVSNHTIYMSDSLLASSIDLENYYLTTTKEKKCTQEPTLVYNNSDYTLYKYCLSEVLVTYPDGQYELSSVLSSNKLNIKTLYENPIKEETDEDGSIIYRFEDYSILLCNPNNSKEIYIGNKNLKFKNIKCNEIVTN